MTYRNLFQGDVPERRRAIDQVQDNRPSGNAYRDQWLAERSEDELRRLEALAIAEGALLRPTTVLRPQLFTQYVENVRGDDTFTLEWYFPYYAYIRKITSTVLHTNFKQNQEPDDALVGTLDPRAYVLGKVERTTHEQIMTDFIPMDEWTGDAEREYVFDLIPFVTRSETLTMQGRISERVDIIDRVQVTMHIMRFPVEGV
jgi:hypothetical protein